MSTPAVASNTPSQLAAAPPAPADTGAGDTTSFRQVLDQRLDQQNTSRAANGTTAPPTSANPATSQSQPATPADNAATEATSRPGTAAVPSTHAAAAATAKGDSHAHPSDSQAASSHATTQLQVTNLDASAAASAAAAATATATAAAATVTANSAASLTQGAAAFALSNPQTAQNTSPLSASTSSTDAGAADISDAALGSPFAAGLTGAAMRVVTGTSTERGQTGEGSEEAPFQLSSGENGAQLHGAMSGDALPSTAAFTSMLSNAAKLAEASTDPAAGKSETSVDIPGTQATNSSLASGQAVSAQVTPMSADGSQPVLSGSASVPYQLGSDAWRADVSSHVVYFSQQDLQSAQLHMNPAHLGPVDIQIKVDNNLTSIAFSAAHEATRQAMQETLPQLRQQFHAQGIALGNTTVDDSSHHAGFAQSQGSAFAASGSSASLNQATGSAPVPLTDAPRIRLSALQMVDTFA